jgi:hypothetical protein
LHGGVAVARPEEAFSCGAVQKVSMSCKVRVRDKIILLIPGSVKNASRSPSVSKRMAVGMRRLGHKYDKST